MQVVIRCTKCSQSNEELKLLEAVLVRQLSRFRRHLKQVQLFIDDVNGPRGGVDKHCRCVLHLRRMVPIVIRDADEHISALVFRVADRAAHTLSRRVGRRLSTRSRS